MGLNPSRIFIVDGDDWAGLYVDGELHTEGHSIRSYDLLKVINQYKIFEDAVENFLNKSGLEWLENNGGLPKKLDEIPLNYFEKDK